MSVSTQRPLPAQQTTSHVCQISYLMFAENSPLSSAGTSKTMRLLQYNNDGEFSLTTFCADQIPRKYAILSHTWEAEEVTFEDLQVGTGTRKAGYNKIRFCGEQARRDGLQYFWVDTCCINKSSSTELSEAINSMFRWYRESTKCYVYLSDVLSAAINTKDLTWESAFRNSKWFTRGWTLQELIAPTSVEFFSKEGELLGNKSILEQQVCEITRIPAKALPGSALSGFSVTERMSWAEQRETTREEDQAYSLLGIFDISIPVIYGEGRGRAMKRLREEIDKASKGIRKLLTRVGVKREDFSVSFSLLNVSEIEHFVAREEELVEIHKTLSSDGSRQTAVLYGLGGIGKTQLSIAYAKQHKDKFSAIFWLNIKDEDSLKQSFARIARQIFREHPSASRLNNVDIEENLNQVVEAVKAWLSLPYNTRWLMIYDNYDNPKAPDNMDPAAVDIQKFLPESYQGSVIITTRSSLVNVGHRIHITKLENLQDSLEILSNASNRKGLIKDPHAVRLAKELDGLPLALATAGAYLDQTAISLPDYLRLYKELWTRLKETSPQLSAYEDRTLYSTWQISFDYIEQRNPLSAKLLRLWAYFDNQDLWFELLRDSDVNDPKWIQELTKDELSFHGAVRVLSNHGLVEVATSLEEQIESKGYSIHGCVHSWTFHVLNQEWDCDLARLAVKLVGAHVPGEKDIRPWLMQRRLLQHAARCSYIVVKGLVADDGIARAYHQLGLLYASQGKLEAAEQMYEWALQGKEKALGAEHTSTLQTVNNLGALYRDQGKLEAAEQMHDRALAGYQKALSAEHTSTLDTFNYLGLLYKEQDKLEAAEQMYERALRGKEKALGAEHMSTLQTFNNLGILYRDQGKLEAAKQMYERALAGYEKALGAEHMSTLQTVNNLGKLYRSLGKLEAAEHMHDRALAGYEKALGAEHTSTLQTVNYLGNLYREQGKLGAAEQMHDRALAGYEKALGVEHTLTLDTFNYLGLLYREQGKPEAAEQMYKWALAGKKKALGTEHTSTLHTFKNQGILYRDQGKLEAAKQMYEWALAGYEKALGVDIVATYIPALDTIWCLGSLFQDKDDFANARVMYSKALVGFDKVVGPDHPSSRKLRDRLRILDERMDNKALPRIESNEQSSEGPSHLGAKGTSQESKRNKLLKKIRFRFR